MLLYTMSEQPALMPAFARFERGEDGQQIMATTASSGTPNPSA